MTRQFKCDFCPSLFARRSTLKTHVLTHTGEKPYKCLIEECNRRFIEKGNMMTHYKTHVRFLLILFYFILFFVPQFSKNTRNKINFPCSKINSNFNHQDGYENNINNSEDGSLAMETSISINFLANNHQKNNENDINMEDKAASSRIQQNAHLSNF
jgi:uncharacterized Zn-finger protein